MEGRAVVKSPHACISWGGSKVSFQNAPPLCPVRGLILFAVRQGCILRLVTSHRCHHSRGMWGWQNPSPAGTRRGWRSAASLVCHTKPTGKKEIFFSMYLKQTNRAETVSEAAFLNAPFAGWEIQREHPLQACPLKDLPPNSSVL